MAEPHGKADALKVIFWGFPEKQPEIAGVEGVWARPGIAGILEVGESLSDGDSLLLTYPSSDLLDLPRAPDECADLIRAIIPRLKFSQEEPLKLMMCADRLQLEAAGAPSVIMPSLIPEDGVRPRWQISQDTWPTRKQHRHDIAPLTMLFRKYLRSLLRAPPGSRARRYCVVMLPSELPATALMRWLWEEWIGPFSVSSRPSELLLSPLAQGSLSRIGDALGIDGGAHALNAAPGLRPLINDEEVQKSRDHFWSLMLKQTAKDDDYAPFLFMSNGRVLFLYDALASGDDGDGWGCIAKSGENELLVLPMVADPLGCAKTAVDLLRRAGTFTNATPSKGRVLISAQESTESVDIPDAVKDVNDSLSKLKRRNPLVGNSEAIRSLYPALVHAIDRKTAGVKIYGEPGTGKEVVSKLLSMLARDPSKYVRANAAAIKGELVASTLYGIAGGVATDVSAREGLFAKAGKGTLLLDQMESAAPELQAAILRALESDTREYQVVGTSESRKVQCRIICAFNEDWDSLVANRRLRRDLAGRLTIEIRLPDLNSRTEDIPLLVDSFLPKLFEDVEPERRRGISLDEVKPTQDELRSWAHQNWSGLEPNVRGLRNAVEKSLMEKLTVLRRQKRASVRSGRKTGRDVSDERVVEFLREARADEHDLAWYCDRMDEETGKKVSRVPSTVRKRLGLIADAELKQTAKSLAREIPGFYQSRATPSG